ncbi:MAG: sialate O-acetylesterase [Verrucomicrobiia bacterium]
MSKLMFLLFIACTLISTPSFADVRLPKILSSHMVLQRNADVNIWGWADPGETIVINADWIKAELNTTADTKGKWSLALKTIDAGEAHSLTITGKNTLHLEDILFGEVWIGSGQSNMEMPLIQVSNAYTGIQNSEKEVANANFPEIRLFQAGNYSSQEPLDDVESGIVMYGVPEAKCEWQPCSPNTIPTFSSTAYFFARELYSKLNVPIGIIDSSWGGTSAESWTPKSSMEKLGMEKELAQADKLPQQADKKIPTRLYNGMIHPLRNFKIKGVIWYQGEGNSGRPDQYRKLFSTMISEWRREFGYDFPFYFAQIAPYGKYNDNSAYLREAQLHTLSLARTGMAVTMDIGNLTDIHPKNKQEVGRRLALWALAKDYDFDIAYSGPILSKSTIKSEKIHLRFDQAQKGLTTNDGLAPSHFEIAGEDRVFHPATAIIKGKQIIVSSEEVSNPMAVRYAFTNDAQPNLINQEGLPASSFRTDEW